MQRCAAYIVYENPQLRDKITSNADWIRPFEFTYIHPVSSGLLEFQINYWNDK